VVWVDGCEGRPTLSYGRDVADGVGVEYGAPSPHPQAWLFPGGIISLRKKLLHLGYKRAVLWSSIRYWLRSMAPRSLRRSEKPSLSSSANGE